MQDIFVISIRTILFYFLIIFAYRIMGKREIGQLGVMDLIVSILIAELVAISIENFNDSLLNTIIPIIILVLIEISLAFLSIKSEKIRSFFEGTPSMIINNVKVNYKEMVKQRYSLDDLLVQLRQNSIKSIEDIEYALLEHNGKLSIFKYNSTKKKTNYPMPLIIDGKVQEETFKNINKNKRWLKQLLTDNYVNIDDVFYAFYKGKKVFIIKKKEIL